jgi:hypothetical protein
MCQWQTEAKDSDNKKGQKAHAKATVNTQSAGWGHCWPTAAEKS